MLTRENSFILSLFGVQTDIGNYAVQEIKGMVLMFYIYVSFNIHSCPRAGMQLLPSFYKWGNWQTNA